MVNQKQIKTLANDKKEEKNNNCEIQPEVIRCKCAERHKCEPSYDSGILQETIKVEQKSKMNNQSKTQTVIITAGFKLIRHCTLIRASKLRTITFTSLLRGSSLWVFSEHLLAPPPAPLLCLLSDLPDGPLQLHTSDAQGFDEALG